MFDRSKHTHVVVLKVIEILHKSRLIWKIWLWKFWYMVFLHTCTFVNSRIQT